MTLAPRWYARQGVQDARYGNIMTLARNEVDHGGAVANKDSSDHDGRAAGDSPEFLRPDHTEVD